MIMLSQLLIIIFVTFVGAKIMKIWDPSLKLTTLIITAMITLITTYLFDFISEKLSDPSAKVNIIKGNNELLVRISVEKPVETLAIDLPILGKIVNIHDNNSVADARTTLKRIVGNQSSYSQNNVEFIVENIASTNPLEYKILFEPIPGNIYIAGTDRYKMSYSWHHKGNLKIKTQWISLAEGKEVVKPNVEIRGFTFEKRALSPEEIKKRYENGLREKEIE